MNLKKKVLIIVFVLFFLSVVGLIKYNYLKNAACEEEKGIYGFWHNFGYPSSGHPEKSYPEFLYYSCPLEYKLPKYITAQRRCEIPDEQTVSDKNFLKYKNREFDCRRLKEITAKEHGNN